MVASAIGILAGAAWGGYLGYRFHFPDTNEVDEFFRNYPALPRDSRATEVERFFSRNSGLIGDHSEFAASVFGQFTKLYLETGDESLLAGIDRARIDTMSGEVLCGFYRDLVRIPAAARHYRTPEGAARLRGCLGEWSEEELRHFLGSG